MWICGHKQHLTHRLERCHFLIVCATCECVHVHLALACVLLLMRDRVTHCVSIPSVVSVSTCLSNLGQWHSQDTFRSLDRHSTLNNTPEACQVHTLVRLVSFRKSLLFSRLFESGSHSPVTNKLITAHITPIQNWMDVFWQPVVTFINTVSAKMIQNNKA